MKKFEAVYRALLINSLREVDMVRQKDVASICHVSLGLVNKTVRKLEAASAVEATPRGLRILSSHRILNLWAAERRIASDVWRSFRLDDVREAERSLPQSVVLTGFSGWSSISGRRPVEYDRLHFYVRDKEKFGLWVSFRESRIRSTNPNMFALYVEDGHLFESSVGGVACLPQIYVDTYSIGGPESQPFLKDIVQANPALSPW